MEAREREGYEGRRVRRALHENKPERPAILHEMWWPSDERPSNLGPGRCLCRHDTEREIHAKRPCQLCGDGAADEGWPSEAEGLPGRDGRIRRSRAGVVTRAIGAGVRRACE